MPTTVRLILLAVITVLALGCDAKVLPFRLPQNGRQVPSDIIVRTDGSGALQFGFEMGTGLRTFVPTHVPHVLVATALLAAPWWATPLLGLAFGFGRTLMVHSAVHSGNASEWDRRFGQRKPMIVALLWCTVLISLAVLGWRLGMSQ
jgi:hypothetical protein